jgi:hypothetical protein
MEERTTHVGLMYFGWSYVRSAEHLQLGVAIGTLKIAFDDPIHFTIGHGIELLFKAFIHSKLNDGNALKNLGHDLVRLRKKAEDLGLVLTLSSSEGCELHRLNSSYGRWPYEVRYLVTGYKGAPLQFIELSSIARRLMDAIEPILCPDRVKNVGLQTRLEPAPNYPADPPSPTVEEAVEPSDETLLRDLFGKESP